jgi:hypothetical protein
LKCGEVASSFPLNFVARKHSEPLVIPTFGRRGGFMSARIIPPPQVENKSKNTRRKWILWTSAVVLGAALMGEQWLALLLLLAGIIFFGTIIVASFHDHFIEGRGSSGDRHRADSGDFGGGGA